MDTAFWDKALPVAVGAAVGGFATIVAIALEKELLEISIVRKRQVYEIRDNRKIKSVLAQLEQKPPAPKSS